MLLPDVPPADDPKMPSEPALVGVLNMLPADVVAAVLKRLPEALVAPKILPEAVVETPKILPLPVVDTAVVDDPKMLVVAGVLAVPKTFEDPDAADINVGTLEGVSAPEAVLPNKFPSVVLLSAYDASKVFPVLAAVPAVPKMLPLNVPTVPNTLPVVVDEAPKIPPPDVVATSKMVPPDVGFDPPKILPVVDDPKVVLLVVAVVIAGTGTVDAVVVVLLKRPLLEDVLS